MKRGMVWIFLLSLVGLGSVFSANATTFTSTNYMISGGVGDSIGGGQTSTNYSLTSIGGNSVAGKAASTNYKLGEGYTARLEDSIQLLVQPTIALKAYWPLDNAAPNAVAFDGSVFDRNGVYSAGSSSVTGKLGNAWSGSGTQSVTASGVAGSSGNKLTVSAWVKPSSSLSQRAIVTKWDYATNPTQGEWALETSTTATELRFYVGSSGDSGSNYVDTTNANLSTGSFSHIVAVYDGSLANAQRVQIYVNGSLSTTSVTGTIPASLNTNAVNPVVVGDFPGRSRYWSGAIDEVKYFSSAFSANEAMDEYNAVNAGVPMAMRLASSTPGIPVSGDFYALMQTNASKYSLAVNQNNNLTSGSNTIAGIPSPISSPTAWVNGTTKGLGMTLVEADPLWNNGAVFGAIPNTATSFYTRALSAPNTGVKDLISLRLQLDTVSSQPTGEYSNTLTLTGTIIP